MNISIIDKLSGKQFEDLLQNILPSLGFTIIERTRITGDFGADIIANRDNKRFAIQAKRYNRAVGIRAVQEAYAAKSYFKTDYCMVATNQAFTMAARELAVSCGCLLLGRTEIQQIIKKEFATHDEFIQFLTNRKVTKYKITNQQLINAYFNLKRNLGTPVRIEDMDALGLYSSSVYRKRWGSWNEFLKSINEPLLQEKKISKERLIEEFKRLKEMIGKIPTVNDMKQHAKFSVATYERAFGSWNRFLSTVGFSIIKKHNISEDEFITEFKRVKDLLGHTPKAYEMRKHGEIAPNSYKRIWGSWTGFLIKMGEPHQKRNLKKNELVECYLKLKKQLKKGSLTQRDMDKYGDFSSSVYIRKFGSWNKFLKELGEESNINTNISKEDLISDYYRVKLEIDKKKLSVNDLRKYGKYSLSTYLKRFIKWENFLKEIGDIDRKQPQNSTKIHTFLTGK